MKKLIIIGFLLAACSPEKNGEGYNDEEMTGNEQGHLQHYAYEPAISTLTGEIRLENFWGPPGYGEDTLTDSKEPCAILILENPIDIEADSASEFNQSLTNVKKIQLVSEAKLNAYYGKQVIVKGTLFGAETGHHHTDALLDVTKIEAK